MSQSVTTKILVKNNVAQTSFSTMYLQCICLCLFTSVADCVCVVYTRRLDDVVVGAPFYLAPLVGGAIYVYMNGPEVSITIMPADKYIFIVCCDYILFGLATIRTNH